MPTNRIDEKSFLGIKLEDVLRRGFNLPPLHPGLLVGVKVLIALMVLVTLFYNLFFVYVRPYEYGIKVVRIGLNRGVQKEIYHAGLTFLLPFGLQQMYLFPKGIQVLELTNFPQTAAKRRVYTHI